MNSVAVPITILDCDMTVTIDYTVTYRGRPALGPSYASGGEPAESPEWEVDCLTLVYNDAEVYVPTWLYKLILDSDTVKEVICDDIAWYGSK